MPHPLVEQLRFARSELRRALADVSDADARQRFLPMNCISWNIGHLAWQEQRYWLTGGQGRVLLPALNVEFAFGAPASTPSVEAMWDAWRAITAATDPCLDAVTTAKLTESVTLPGWGIETTFGSLMLRVIDHYWYHIGESMAIRQLLGQLGLPDFVGDIEGEAPYRPEHGSATMVPITDSYAISLDEIEWEAVRAQGAGGQNVNKVATTIHLRFDIRASSLPDLWKERLLQLRDHRITADGILIIKAQRYRSQERNREDALAQLQELVRRTTVERKKRRPTKPTAGARKQRLEGKKQRGQVKALRGQVRDE